MRKMPSVASAAAFAALSAALFAGSAKAQTTPVAGKTYKVGVFADRRPSRR